MALAEAFHERTAAVAILVNLPDEVFDVGHVASEAKEPEVLVQLLAVDFLVALLIEVVEDPLQILEGHELIVVVSLLLRLRGRHRRGPANALRRARRPAKLSMRAAECKSADIVIR